MEWYKQEISHLKGMPEIYTFLDTNANKLAKDDDLINALLFIKDQGLTEDEKQYMAHEVEIFCFQLMGKNIFSFSYSNDPKTSKVLKYPDLNKLQIEAFDYLIERAKSSNASYLKARYNHILWKSSKKNQCYAEESIIGYLKTMEESILVFSTENDGYSSFIGRLHENLLCVVNESKLELDKTREITSKILSESTTLPFWLKRRVIEKMIDSPRIFMKEDFSNSLTLFEKEKQNQKRVDDFSWVNYSLPTAIKIAQKIKSDVKKWYDEIGHGNVRIAEEELNNEDSRAIIKISMYSSAIAAYRKSGNHKKRVEIEKKYFDLKPKVRLDHFQIDFDEKTISMLEQHNENLKQDAINQLKNKPDFIYSFIGKGNFFPKLAAVEKASNENRSTFFDFATTLHFDQNKNIRNSTNEERQRIMDTYNTWMNQTLLPYLHYLIILGIKSGRLNTKNLIQHLIQNSWIGKPKVSMDFDGKRELTNWINLLTPSILEFHNQIIAWGTSKYYHPSFILCTDSLVLKIEGLFRDFSERFGVPTSKGKRKGIEEVQIHDILSNDRIRKYFNEDDFLFFDYVFSKEGLNIRNNVAHCFYQENEYHPDKMLLLLAVLLRLGKYNIVRKKA